MVGQLDQMNNALTYVHFKPSCIFDQQLLINQVLKAQGANGYSASG